MGKWIPALLLFAVLFVLLARVVPEQSARVCEEIEVADSMMALQAKYRLLRDEMDILIQNHSLNWLDDL